MTQEEKELLFKDLSARLPYGVIIKTILNNGKLIGFETEREELHLRKLNDKIYRYYTVLNDDPKPYLRPMSSMTEEEKEIYSKLEINIKNSEGTLFMANCNLLQRFFASHHLDNNHLIEGGLALEAPEGMYNFHKNMSYRYFPIEFSSYEDYIKYLKKKKFAIEVTEEDNSQ